MGHAHQEIYLHLVWATRGREPLLVGEAERRIHRCLQSEAEKLRCVVLAVNGMPDHIHLALQLPTSLCVAQIVKQLKGASSRLATKELVDHEAILPFFAWQEGYGVFSPSRPHLTQVVTYIQNQKRHHQSGKLWQSWEKTETDTEPTGAS